jgi:hypothetical protein
MGVKDRLEHSFRRICTQPYSWLHQLASIEKYSSISFESPRGPLLQYHQASSTSSGTSLYPSLLSTVPHITQCARPISSFPRTTLEGSVARMAGW